MVVKETFLYPMLKEQWVKKDTTKRKTTWAWWMLLQNRWLKDVLKGLRRLTN